MIKLTVATLAALYAILYVFGDDARRPAEVTRSAPPALNVVDVTAMSQAIEAAPKSASRVSEAEAVQLAMAAGEKLRLDRRQAPLRSIAVADAGETPSTETAPKPEMFYRYVTGKRVNLRRGPGTGNPVVAQVTRGTEAEVLSDRNGWFEIRLTNGTTSGWIFGDFLAETRPG